MCLNRLFYGYLFLIVVGGGIILESACEFALLAESSGIFALNTLAIQKVKNLFTKRSVKIFLVFYCQDMRKSHTPRQ